MPVTHWQQEFDVVVNHMHRSVLLFRRVERFWSHRRLVLCFLVTCASCIVANGSLWMVLSIDVHFDGSIGISNLFPFLINQLIDDCRHQRQTLEAEYQ